MSTQTATDLPKTARGHSVEKIGGTSMSEYQAVRDNVVFSGADARSALGRVFVVSAYGGVTDRLLEHKKTGDAGVYAIFREGESDACWREALENLRQHMFAINAELFTDSVSLKAADRAIGDRVDTVFDCLANLETLCQHGHFSLEVQLDAVREMLASLGEAHSAWNLAALLRRDGVPAVFVDLTGWQDGRDLALDERIEAAFADIDLHNTVPIVTGYARSGEGLMRVFDRGYSEMTFSRIAVLTGAREAIIHKEYHLSSADPKVVGEDAVVPIGRTNYDVADQLSGLGMEAIHPMAARGLREAGIPLRVKNTFEPEHTGTLITADYVSAQPCVEIVAGRRGVHAIEHFDQDMVGALGKRDGQLLSLLERHGAKVIAKDVNANTVTHYVSCSLKRLKRIIRDMEAAFPEAQITSQRVALVSAIGSDLQVRGILADTAKSLAEAGVSVMAVHQTRRQIEMRFVVEEADYQAAIAALHRSLVESLDHGRAIALAS